MLRKLAVKLIPPLIPHYLKTRPRQKKEKGRGRQRRVSKLHCSELQTGKPQRVREKMPVCVCVSEEALRDRDRKIAESCGKRGREGLFNFCITALFLPVVCVSSEKKGTQAQERKAPRKKRK